MAGGIPCWDSRAGDETDDCFMRLGHRLGALAKRVARTFFDAGIGVFGWCDASLVSRSSWRRSAMNT